NKEFLRNLPVEVCFRAGKFEVMIVHGSPLQLNEYLYEGAKPEYLMELLNIFHCDVLICGHTHVPYHKVLNPGKHVINAGSVGKPKHGDPQAAYVIIEFGETVEVHIQKVAYDVESMAMAGDLSGLPKEFAEALRTGVD
ncbi:MAG: metallophosphoesterase family protein, partial [Desulfotomaculaceae bacterium]|nr:metallophosphoesterase family protein [Desulfotomaculaceae bacterium]